MIHTSEKRPAKKDVVLFGGWPDTRETLSGHIIPAVPGEYYAYSSRFTLEKPLYTLLKCKSNKFWTIASAEMLGSEANLLFRFNSATSAEVCALKTAHASGLLGSSVSAESFGETWVAPAGITAERFYQLHSLENAEALVAMCNTACQNRETSTSLKPGLVVAMMTDAGKYGMFLVKRLTPESIHIDACHILL